MKKFSLLFMLAIGLFFMTSCEEDNGDGGTTTLAGPTVGTPSPSSVQAGTTANVTIPVTAAGGIATVTATTSAGSVSVDASSFTVGGTSASVVVAYTAPATAGNQIITLTVTDQQTPALSETESVLISVTTDPVTPTKDIFASEEGTGTVTWSADTIYILRGFVFVNDGQKLTIEPGTVIKGQPGTGAGASALIVARGGEIDAQGTANNPIIFTALADDPTDPSDLAANTRGAWGGLILLGGAFINHANGETNIEGVPAEDEPRGLYGVASGSAAANDDNSGILTYISLRHGATNIGAGNEINGLTMGGVGNMTTVSYVETFAFDDDGFEWFGGTVNSDHLASIWNQDDSFDMDFGWRGQNQFWVAFQEPGFTGSDRGFESDGAHSGNLGAAIFSQPQIYNATIIGQGNSGNNDNCLFMTEGFATFLHNSIVMNFPRGINLTTVGATNNTSRDRLANGDLVFANNMFWNISAAATTVMDSVASDGTGVNAALLTHLNNNNNMVMDPQLGGTGSADFNPLPMAAGNAFTMARNALPGAAVNNFTYTTADYIGAFGDTNWLTGWTAVEHYGIMQ